MFAHLFFRTFPRIIACLAIVGLAGCASYRNPHGLGTRVAVLIADQEAEVILAEARKTFERQGYEKVSETKTGMVLEQKGSGWQSAAYGDWGGGVWKRVRLTLEEHGPDTLELEAKAALIRDRGDAFFEEEKQPSRSWKEEVQETLDAIRSQLNWAGPQGGQSN